MYKLSSVSSILTLNWARWYRDLQLVEMRYMFTYFTIWSLMACMLPLPLSPWLRFFMSLQSSVGGFYITYIYPRRLVVPYLNMIISGSLMRALDILTHHAPLLYWMRFDTRSMPPHPWILHLPVVFYLACFSLHTKYLLRPTDHGAILALYSVVYVMAWMLLVT